MDFPFFIKRNKKSLSAQEAYPELEVYEKGFSDYYTKNIAPISAQFRADRRAFLREKLWVFLPAFFVLGAVTFLWLYVSFVHFRLFIRPSVSVGFLLTFLAVFYWISCLFSQFSPSYRSEILPSIADFFGSFTYEKDKGLSHILTDLSGIGPMHTHYYMQDYVQGEYRKTRFEMCQASFSLFRALGGFFALERQVFEGNMIHMKLPFILQGRTILLTKEDGFHLHSNETRKKIQANFFPGMNTFAHEQSSFASELDIFTNDAPEAALLLSSDLMYRILYIINTHDGAAAEICFWNDSLLILLSGKDSFFEPTIWQNDIPQESIRVYLARFYSVLTVADALSVSPLIDAHKNNKQQKSPDMLLTDIE